MLAGKYFSEHEEAGSIYNKAMHDYSAASIHYILQADEIGVSLLKIYPLEASLMMIEASTRL